ncbi:MAG: phosphate acyltransferase PlsX [Anaerolineae bacterium]|nr:phosphate acyltransferase PlsX [Anaerolineae bacterium]
MRIVVDAMGSDKNPVPDVEGAVLAAREYGDTVILVGDQPLIENELARYSIAGLSLDVVHAAQHVTMTDRPSVVGRGKPDSSMHVGMRLVRDGQGDAFVTAGNTGAVLAIATLHTLRRIPGVFRPALSTILPVQKRLMILLDIGTNADCRAEWLEQFALMGSLYAERALGCSVPRVALLSNGEEEGKGNMLVREAAELLAHSGVNFIGNVEPKDVLGGAADVVVMDGFSGNVFIKSLEAMSSTLLDIIRDELTADLRSKMGGLLSKPAFRRAYHHLDPFEIGGAPLLGVNGVVIIGHGRSNARAIKNAVRQARQAVSGQIVEAITTGLAKTSLSANDQTSEQA